MEKTRIKILHITPHFGGGVGRVLLNYFLETKKNFFLEHNVACLDYANDAAISLAKKNGFVLRDKMSDKRDELLEMIKSSDIVLVHWWNHPLLYDFLVRSTLPPCLLIIWSHNSGFSAPCVFTKKILNYPDFFVFTTPISFQTKEVKQLSAGAKKNLRVIWSTGGIDHVKGVKPKKHIGFNVGYIGTVDYAKLHPHFLAMCGKISISDLKFIVCGGPSEKEIKDEAEKMGVLDRINFTGQILDTAQYLQIFDIFGYPLAKNHYGTCEQVLQESMAAGVVPVVLANPAESYIVKNKLTGIVAKNEREYVKAIKVLYNNHQLRNLLSKNARKYALENFSLEKMANEWNKIFDEVLNFPKTVKKWDINKKNITSRDVFLESLGGYGKPFVDYCNVENNKDKKLAIEKIKRLGKLANWRSKNKSTVHHYNFFFPNDKYLNTWSKLMK